MYVTKYLLAGALSRGIAETDAAVVTSEPLALPVFIVEQHSTALRCWIEGLGYEGGSEVELYRWLQEQRPHSLLHIDSHSDLMEVEWDSKYPVIVRNVLAGDDEPSILAAKLLLDAQIGDFIPSAMFANLIGDVVWLRSDFRLGEYNGPPPGAYAVTLGLSHQSVEEYESDKSAEILCFKRRAEWFRAPTETFHNRRTERFVSCKGAAPYGAPVTANVTVATLAQLLPRQQEHSEQVSVFPEVQLSNEGWILDIDLDFFSTSDPSIALFTHNGFKVHWVLYHVFQAVHCEKEDDLEHLLEFFHHVNRRHHMVLALRHAQHMLRDTSCKIKKPKFHKLLRSLSRFNARQRAAWARSFPSKEVIDEWTGDFMTSMFSTDRMISPHHYSSKRFINLSLRRLERLLRGYVERYGEPAVITISRSMKFDHYLPENVLPYVEGHVLGMLRRIMTSSNKVHVKRQLHISCYLGHASAAIGASGNGKAFDENGETIDCTELDVDIGGDWKALHELLNSGYYSATLKGSRASHYEEF